MNASCTRCRFHVLFPAAALLGFLNLAAAVFAQSPRVIPLDSVQRLYVPEDRPGDWPFRDQKWFPLDRAEFERLLARRVKAPVGPPDCLCRHVRYSSVLSGDTLTQGRLRAEFQALENHSRYFSLGTPTLAIEELSWSRHPAAWGTGLEGRHWLRIEKSKDVLEGRWTARGRSLKAGVAFDLEFLPAAISELELQTDVGQTVTSDVGDVERLPVGSDDTFSRWRISLGDQTRCRLIVSTGQPAAVGAPTVLYEQELSVTVGQDEMQFWQTFQIEVLDGDVERLTISLPRSLEIVTATYGDANQTPLKFERIPGEGPGAQLSVHLPEAVRGRSRPIRLEGYGRRGAGDSATIPQLMLEGGVWLEGRVNVTIARSLELRSYRAPGYRQLLPASQRADGEFLSFQQLAPRPQLLLNVERPSVERQAHALNLLTTDQKLWTLTAEIAWESRSGTVFDARCRFPDGWRVTSVVQLGGGRESQELAGWEVQPHPESGQILRLEFPEGLTSGRVDPVRVIAQRDVSIGPIPARAPLILPLDCESSEVLFQFDPRIGDEPSWTSGGQFEPFEVQTAAAVWNTLRSWPAVIDTPSDAGRLLHLINVDSNHSFAAEDDSSRLQAAANVDIELAGDRVHERFEIRLSRLPTAGREIELYFPRREAGIAWSWSDSDAEVAVRRHSPRQTSGARTLPNDGEISVVTLPEEASGQLTLIGQRDVHLTDEYPIPLIFVPRALVFQGTVTLKPDQDDTYSLHEQPRLDAASGAADVPVVERLSMQPRTWNYRNWDSGWRLHVRQRHAPEAVPVSYRLKSVLGRGAAGFDFHQLTLSPVEPESFDGCRFQLPAPAELVAVMLNGRTMPVTYEGPELILAGDEDSTAWKQLVVTFRIPVIAAWGGARHRFELPRFSWNCHEFSWQVSAPPSLEFQHVSPGLPLSPRTPQLSWWRRLGGPLSQSPEERLFSWPGFSIDGAAPAVESHVGTLSANHFPDGWPVYSGAGLGLPVVHDFFVLDRQSIDLMSWVLMIACLPVGLMLRRWRSTWRNRAAAIALASAASMALFGPEPWNSVSGGLFSGLLISLLLPAGCWMFQRASSSPVADASASTEIFRRAALPLALWFVLCGAISWSVAQEETPKAVHQKHEVYRVLVPVGSDRQPSRKQPVVYVSPALYDALHQLEDADGAEPSQLISTAEYLIYSDENRRRALKIKYVIDLLSDRDPAVLAVPHERSWQGGLEACYVDGRVQMATASPDGRFLLLPCDRRSPQEGDADAGRQSQRHEVLLEIRLPAAKEAQHEQFHADLFPVLNSRLSWQSPQGLAHVELPEARGLMTMSLDRRLCEAQLGAIRELTLRRSPENEALSGEGQTDLEVLQLLTLRPSATQATFRVECRVIDGAVNRLEIDLPHGGVLRSVSPDKLLQTFTQPQSEGGSTVFLEFTEPQRQNFVIEGEYLVPRASADQAIDFPRIQIRCGRQTAPLRQLVAVGCGPEFSAQLINLDDPTVLPIPIEQFATRWGDIVPSQQLHFAFQVQDGGQPAFRLIPVHSEQQSMSWREDVVLSSRGLDWTLTADMKSTVWPALSFSVLLDRRLTIDAVSVLDKGVEQRSRWSKTPMIGSSQNRVTIFLSREATGVCQIRVHGSIRFRPNSPMTLPSMRFETPQSVSGVLLLFHEAGYRVQLEGRQSELDSNSSAPETHIDHQPVKFFKRLKVPEGDSGLVARLEPVAGRCTVQSLWYVDPSTPEWHAEGWMQLTPEEGTRDVSVVVPDWLSQAQLILPEGGAAPAELFEHGQRVLQATFPGDGLRPTVLKWTTDLPATQESAVSLKLPAAMHAVKSDDWGMVAPQDQWTISARPHVPVATLPVAMREQLTHWNADSTEFVSRLTDGAFVLNRLDGRSPDGVSSIESVEHLLQGSLDGGWRGQTDFYPALSAGIVEISLPQGLEVRNLSADEAPVSLDEWNAETRRWRVVEAGRYRRLTVRWSAPPPELRYGLLGQAAVSLPQCIQERQPKSSVALIGSDDAWFVFPGTMQRRTGWDFAFDRLELEFRRYQQLRDSQEFDLGAGQALWRDYVITAESLSAQHLIDGLTAADRNRWQAIVQGVTQIEEPIGRSGNALPTSVDSLQYLTDSSVVFGSLDSAAGQLEGWVIRRKFLQWIAAGLTLMLLSWLLPRVAGWLFLPWWQERRHAAWLLFGIVWWFCWSPKIIGLAMMAWSLAEWLKQRRPETPALDVNPPSAPLARPV